MARMWRRFGVCWLGTCVLILAGTAQGASVALGTLGSVPLCTYAELQGNTCQQAIDGYLATISDGLTADPDRCADAGSGGGSDLVTCRYNGSDWEEFSQGGGGGSGDVVGPSGGVVDTELACFNSTTGKLIEGCSGVTVDSNGVFSGPATGGVDFPAHPTNGKTFTAKEATANGVNTFVINYAAAMDGDIVCNQQSDGTMTGPSECPLGGSSKTYEFAFSANSVTNATWDNYGGVFRVGRTGSTDSATPVPGNTNETLWYFPHPAGSTSAELMEFWCMQSNSNVYSSGYTSNIELWVEGPNAAAGNGSLAKALTFDNPGRRVRVHATGLPVDLDALVAAGATNIGLSLWFEDFNDPTTPTTAPAFLCGGTVEFN